MNDMNFSMRFCVVSHMLHPLLKIANEKLILSFKRARFNLERIMCVAFVEWLYCEVDAYREGWCPVVASIHVEDHFVQPPLEYATLLCGFAGAIPCQMCD